jgi:pimeloyl-ACP methyl ester carboxylesterase
MSAPWYVKTGFAALGTVAPPLASAWAERLFMTPQRHPVPAREAAALATALPGAITVDGQRIATWRWDPVEGDLDHYLSQGAAGRARSPVVLLAHGWAGRGGQLVGFVPGLLAAGYTVLTFDGPGHGMSDGRTSSLVEHGRALRALAASLAADGHHVHAIVAHSMGGAATTFALSEGLAVGRAVFVAPPTRVTDWSATFAQAVGLSDAVRVAMQQRVEARLGVAWASLDMAVLAPRMEIPLLVVHDRDDREVPWTSGAALAGMWPGAVLHTTEKLGHKRILEDADVLARVLAFVTG